MAEITLTATNKGSYDVRTLLSPLEQPNPVNQGALDINVVYWRAAFFVRSFDPLKTTFSKGVLNEYRFGKLFTTAYGKVSERWYLNFEQQFSNLKTVFPREYYVGLETGAVFSFVVSTLIQQSGDTLYWDLFDGVVCEIKIVAIRSATFYSSGAWI